MPEWFAYLKHLDVPGKLRISHNIIEKLIGSDLKLVESEDDLNYDDIVDHGDLSSKQLELEGLIKKLSIKESAFQIAQIEYENKEERFLEKTNFNHTILDQKYADQDLLLRDIDDTMLLNAIGERNWKEIQRHVGIMTVVISRDVDIFYDRVKLLMKLWIELSTELTEKIKSFEYRGLKVVSTNLRVKLIPVLEEFKQGLKDTHLKEESISRGRIEVELQDMVKRAREDLYGELTGSQISLLEEINPDLIKDELISILKSDTIRRDLIVLLETDKIELRMKKVIDRLI